MHSNMGTFCRYVFPSIGSSMITALYFVVDGIFIGQGVGTQALAAVNLALPVIILVISLTMMLTMGGGTLTSIHLGEQQPEPANAYFRVTLWLVLIFSLLVAALCFLFPRPVAMLCGASGELIDDTALYLRWYCLFLGFYDTAMCLSVFVRNDGNPQLAMWAMTAGALCNIFLDWLFIFPLKWGIFGAAVASGIGQMLACGILLLHFVRKKGQLSLAFPRQKEWKLWGQIARRGMPEFFTQMSQTVTIWCYNQLALQYLGPIGVAAFAVMCYLVEIFIAVFLGVSQGIQPLISFNYGAKQRKKMLFFFRWGMILNVALAALVYLMMVLAGEPLIAVFNSDPRLVAAGCACARIYGISFIFAAANIVYTCWFLSTKRTAVSLLIAGARSFVLNTALIFLIPALLGEAFLWSGIIVAEVLLALTVSVICIVKRQSFCPSFAEEA